MNIWLFSYILGYNRRILGIWKVIKLLWRIPPEKLSSLYIWKFDLSGMSVQNTLWQREFFLWGCCNTIVIYSPKSACSVWSPCGWCLDVVRIDPFLTSVWPVGYLLQQPFSSSDLVTVAQVHSHALQHLAFRWMGLNPIETKISLIYFFFEIFSHQLSWVWIPMQVILLVST